MSFAFHIFRFEDVSRDISNAVQWLQGMGFNYANTRIGAYNTCIEELMQALKDRNVETVQNRDSEFTNALYEACEFTYLYRALHHISERGLLERLSKLFKGPGSYTKEDSDNAGNLSRNIAFELNIAARLIEAGLTPQSDPLIDLSIELGNERIFIECKRPQTGTKVVRKVKEARKQLHNKMLSQPLAGALGLIAIDITKVQNPNFDIHKLVGDNKVKEYLIGVFDSFDDKYFSKFNLVGEKGIVGLLARYSCMVLVEERNMLDYCQIYSYGYPGNASSRLGCAANKLANILVSSIKGSLSVS